MYPCDPISFKYMKIRGEASYYYAEIKEFVKDLDVYCANVFLLRETKLETICLTIEKENVRLD